MTAKDKQTEFIKTYLKPTLKQYGYQTSGLTWWKDSGDFFHVINLQNYSWNSKDSVDFRFNIGIAIKATIKDPQKKKPSYHDLTTHVTENIFLSDPSNRKYGNNQGYSIIETTDLSNFTAVLRYDFEKLILPGLDKIGSLEDCLRFYEPIPFWSEHLKQVISENR